MPMHRQKKYEKNGNRFDTDLKGSVANITGRSIA